MNDSTTTTTRCRHSVTRAPTTTTTMAAAAAAAAAYDADVVILGAGFAGLHAARCLSFEHPERRTPERGGAATTPTTTTSSFAPVRCVVVDARGEPGGRVRVDRDVAPWDVNSGPEFIHGDEHSALKRFIDACGFATREREWPDRYYLGLEDALLSADDAEETNADVREVHRLFDELPDVPDVGGKDVTALEWLTARVRASGRVISLAENIYANDFCASLGKLGMHEVIEEKKKWIYGEKYLVLDRPLREVALELARGVDVRTNWDIASVDYSQPDRVVVTRKGSNDKIVAKKCVVALPITALRNRNRDNSVKFIPRLPAAKINAAETIQMGNAAKVFIGFSEIVWPEDLFDVVCTDCFLPEFWITTYPKSSHPRQAKNAREAEAIAATKGLVTFFVAGDLANKIAKMKESDVIAKAIEQLDRIFKTSCKERVTTTKIVNWANERLTQGAYTHPSVHAGNSRTLLAASVSNALFFAGEATHEGVNPCLQGAMETGERAAHQTRAALFGVGSSRL